MVRIHTLPEVSEFSIHFESPTTIAIYRNGQYCRRFSAGDQAIWHICEGHDYLKPMYSCVEKFTTKTVRYANESTMGYYKFCRANWDLPNTPPQP